MSFKGVQNRIAENVHVVQMKCYAYHFLSKIEKGLHAILPESSRQID